jgi:PIN domain nuclease of toxin-antitoxin system
LNGYLLDTSVALIALTDPDALTPAVREAILEARSHLSVISYWEVLLKSMKGKLNVGDPRDWWTQAQEQLLATPLMLRAQHLSGIFNLPQIHKDPFDRVLIATAMVESLTLLTTDKAIKRYAASGLEVIT